MSKQPASQGDRDDRAPSPFPPSDTGLHDFHSPPVDDGHQGAGSSLQAVPYSNEHDFEQPPPPSPSPAEIQAVLAMNEVYKEYNPPIDELLRPYGPGTRLSQKAKNAFVIFKLARKRVKSWYEALSTASKNTSYEWKILGPEGQKYWRDCGAELGIAFRDAKALQDEADRNSKTPIKPTKRRSRGKSAKQIAAATVGPSRSTKSTTASRQSATAGPSASARRSRASAPSQTPITDPRYTYLSDDNSHQTSSGTSSGINGDINTDLPGNPYGVSVDNPFPLGPFTSLPPAVAQWPLPLYQNQGLPSLNGSTNHPGQPFPPPVIRAPMPLNYDQRPPYANGSMSYPGRQATTYAMDQAQQEMNIDRSLRLSEGFLSNYEQGASFSMNQQGSYTDQGPPHPDTFLMDYLGSSQQEQFSSQLPPSTSTGLSSPPFASLGLPAERSAPQFQDELGFFAGMSFDPSSFGEIVHSGTAQNAGPSYHVNNAPSNAGPALPFIYTPGARYTAPMADQQLSEASFDFNRPTSSTSVVSNNSQDRATIPSPVDLDNLALANESDLELKAELEAFFKKFS